MDFVLNEFNGEEVRAASENALRQQGEELRDAAVRFEERATQLEERANQLQSTLPVTTTESYTTTNSNGDTVWRTRTVTDHAATQARRNQIADLRAQAQELRRVAREFVRAADNLSRAITVTNNIYNQQQREAKQVDGFVTVTTITDLMYILRKHIAAFII